MEKPELHPAGTRIHFEPRNREVAAGVMERDYEACAEERGMEIREPI